MIQPLRSIATTMARRHQVVHEEDSSRLHSCLGVFADATAPSRHGHRRRRRRWPADRTDPAERMRNQERTPAAGDPGRRADPGPDGLSRRIVRRSWTGATRRARPPVNPSTISSRWSCGAPRLSKWRRHHRERPSATGISTANSWSRPASSSQSSIAPPSTPPPAVRSSSGSTTSSPGVGTTRPKRPQMIWYAVRSVCCGGRESGLSNIARLVPETPPAPPTDLALEAEADGIRLTWVPQRGVSGDCRTLTRW